MAERVGIRSRGAAPLPLGGLPPRASASLRSPREGGTPPSEPPVRTPPSSSASTWGLGSTPSIAAFDVMAERVGFEPTVPLPAHVLSRHADSATLAPLRATKHAILTWGFRTNKKTPLTLTSPHPTLSHQEGRGRNALYLPFTPPDPSLRSGQAKEGNTKAPSVTQGLASLE